VPVAHNVQRSTTTPEKNYVLARYHFLHANDGHSFASMMIECQGNFGYPSEYDLFLAQCVLQLLFLRNADTARQFFNTYTRCHPKSSHLASAAETSSAVDYGYPLVNFIAFLLATVRSRDVRCYETLLKLYKPHLTADASFGEVSTLQHTHGSPCSVMLTTMLTAK
jgi:hypothetical protein